PVQHHGRQGRDRGRRAPSLHRQNPRPGQDVRRGLGAEPGRERVGMPQLLLELLSEEIPARMQAGAARDLERMARERLAAEGLLPEALKTFAGSRRLTLVAEGLPEAQKDRSEERKGPRTDAPEQPL